MPDRVRLDGKAALVTGAAGVIGSATIRLLAERGARIVAVAGNREACKARSTTCPPPRRPSPSPANVTNEDEVTEDIRTAVNRFGPVDVSSNNAAPKATSNRSPNIRFAMFRKVIDVNVVGVFLGMKRVLPVMLKQDGFDRRAYGIAGDRGLQREQACRDRADQERGMGVHGTGVRIDCVCPRLIDSRTLSSILQGRSPGNAPPPNDKTVERIPARRLGRASEVASIVAFLASDEASYVSGFAYTVDGGRTAAY